MPCHAWHVLIRDSPNGDLDPSAMFGDTPHVDGIFDKRGIVCGHGF